MNPLVAIAGTGALGYAAFTIPRNVRNANKARAEAKANVRTVINVDTYGLVRDAQLITGSAGPDPEADAVAAAARSGDWHYPATYLAGAGRDWDLRWYRLGIISDVAAEDDAWLRAWQYERPGDPDAALVHADALLELAGRLRGQLGAKYTTAEQFDAFHRVQAQALPACQEAARLAPEDPGPWVAQLSIAIGLGWSHQQFWELWAQITARDPHHFGAHTRALQYWCAKWRGSHELMFEFAERGAVSAPWGSLLPVLRLYAMFEQSHREGDSLEIYQQPFVTAAVDATLDAVAQADPAHHRLPLVRHLLAYTLFRTQRYAEAVEQFYAVGAHIGSVPWTYSSDPRTRYIHARVHTFANWEKAGRPPAPTRY